MADPLATTVIIAALAMAGWAFLTAARDRPPGLPHLAGLAVVELLMLILAALAVSTMVGGERPGELATFIGYLIAAVLVLPAGAGLAMLEQTRWGAFLIGIAALVLPVLVLRLSQIWHA